jgi:hypothetical protein
MDELDYWRLCEELNIVQAAFLVVGEAPTQAEYVEQWDMETRPTGYEAAKTAICGALKNFVLYKKELAGFESQNNHWREEYLHAPDLVSENDGYLTALYRRSI